MPFTPETAHTGTQFKPGQSGNPNGKPKGTKHISTWINEMLNDEKFTAMIRDGYELKEYKGAPVKAIVGAQIALAVNGDKQAADLLFKHGAPAKLLLGNDPDNPLLSNQISDEELDARIADIITRGESRAQIAPSAQGSQPSQN